MTTLRQIEANKKNAEKSTGPKTDSGKLAARANALKHGLSGDGVVALPEELALFAARLEEWRPMFAAELVDGDSNREHLFRQVVLNSLRIEAAQRREIDIRQGIKDRAEFHWGEDREAVAETMGEKLLKSKNPGLVLARLKTFLQGLQWLIAQWAAMERILARGEGLNETQKNRFDALMGLAHDFRTDDSAIETESALAIVRARLEQLQGTALENARELDDRERLAAEERGFLPELSRDERLNRRYEDLAHRRYHWALKQLNLPRSQAPSTPQVPLPAEPASPPEPEENEVRYVYKRQSQIFEEEFQERLRKEWEEQQVKLRNEATEDFGKMLATVTPIDPWDTASQVRITPVRS